MIPVYSILALIFLCGVMGSVSASFYAYSNHQNGLILFFVLLIVIFSVFFITYGSATLNELSKKKINPKDLEDHFDIILSPDMYVKSLSGDTVRIVGETLILKGVITHYIPLSKVVTVEITTNKTKRSFPISDFRKLYKERLNGDL